MLRNQLRIPAYGMKSSLRAEQEHINGSLYVDLTAAAEDVIFLGMKISKKDKQQILQKLSPFTPVLQASPGADSSRSSSSSSSSYESRWDKTGFRPINTAISQPIAPSDPPSPASTPEKKTSSIAALSAVDASTTDRQVEKEKPAVSYPPATSIDKPSPTRTTAPAASARNTSLLVPDGLSWFEGHDEDSDCSMSEVGVETDLQVANATSTKASSEHGRGQNDGATADSPMRPASREGIKHTILIANPRAPICAAGATHALPQRPIKDCPAVTLSSATKALPQRPVEDCPAVILSSATQALPQRPIEDCPAAMLSSGRATQPLALHPEAHPMIALDPGGVPESQEDLLERMEAQAHEMLITSQNYLQKQRHHEHLVRLSAEAAARWMRLSASMTRAVGEQRALTGQIEPDSAKRRDLGSEGHPQVHPERQLLLSQGMREQEELELERMRRSQQDEDGLGEQQSLLLSRLGHPLPDQREIRPTKRRRRSRSPTLDDFDRQHNIGTGSCTPSSNNAATEPWPDLGLLGITDVAAPVSVSYRAPRLEKGVLRRVATSRASQARKHAKVVRFLDLDGAVVGKDGPEHGSSI